MIEHARANVVDARERRRIVPLARGQPGARGAGLAQAPAHEHLRRRVAHAELALEREHRGDVARGDLQAWRIRGHAREATRRARRKRVVLSEFAGVGRRTSNCSAEAAEKRPAVPGPTMAP